jgi:hypothetical protein
MVCFYSLRGLHVLVGHEVILSHYCSSTPPPLGGETSCPRRPRSDPYLTYKSLDHKKFIGIQLVTRSLPCFTQLHSLFYVKRNNGVVDIKVIPSDIYDLLTPAALAHWIMGDGAKRG